MTLKFYDNEKLIEARQLRGKTQADIAKEVGVSKMLMVRAESGGSVSFEAIAKLCQHYQIPVNTIIYPYPLATV